LPLRIESLRVGDALPTREHTPTSVSLFLYNAAVWNPHRIHYDEPYTTQTEKHPGIVIDGPLQGDWLAQCVLNWLGDDGELLRFAYSNRRATYLGETLTSGGRVTEVDAKERVVRVELFVKNAAGEVMSPGSASVRFRE
jgi:3-methylfumaryl-CoA hydratase